MPCTRVLSLSLAVATALALLAPGDAQAQTDFDYRGLIESDLRLAVPGADQPEGVPDFFFARTDNTARLTVAMSWAQVEAIVDLALTFSGRSEVDAFGDLHQRAKVDPWYFESDALYLAIYDFVIDGVDLRLGRQVVDWGKADIFNPTSVINPYDLEDPLDFGRKIANEMVTLSISPPWIIEGEETPILDELNLMLVAVPVFRSLLLPDSARLAFTSPEQFARFIHSQTLANLVDVQNAFLQYGSVGYGLSVEEPSPELENMQFGTRLAASVFGIDLSAIYYYGFDHNVQPQAVNVGGLTLADGSVFPYPEDLSDTDSLIGLIHTLGGSGFFDGAFVDTHVVLSYPRVHVVGGSVATSLDFLGGVGIWAEFAGTFHDGVEFALSLADRPACQPDGSPPDGAMSCIPRETQVEPGFFWKLTTGLDYSITSWWYVNVQYLHGFVDEFGSENLGDYVVAGMDFKTFSEQMLIRLFTIVELDTEPEEASAILYPELTFGFWQNAQLVAGALLHLGEHDTKFGNRTAGPNLVFFKGRYAF